jgi:hypothetical protein
MTPKLLPYLAMLGSVVLGGMALFTGDLYLQLLGGLAILIAIGAGISQVQMNQVLKTPPPLRPPRKPGDPPYSTLGDRLFAMVFLGATIIIVLALAVYTAWELELF